MVRPRVNPSVKRGLDAREWREISRPPLAWMRPDVRAAGILSGNLSAEMGTVPFSAAWVARQLLYE